MLYMVEGIVLKGLVRTRLHQLTWRGATGTGPQPRAAIIRLVLEIARAGLRPFGQLSVQFMIVWHR
jgi:hypothetical protein